MFEYLAVKIFAVIMLIYFIIDLITTLVGKAIEQKKEEKENSKSYITDNYAIDLDNTQSIDIKKSDIGIPEIPSNMSKKVSKAKEKMK